MSLTAKRPRGANSEKGSTHMGLLGISLTIAASPDLMNLGSASVDLPKYYIINKATCQLQIELQLIFIYQANV